MIFLILILVGLGLVLLEKNGPGMQRDSSTVGEFRNYIQGDSKKKKHCAVSIAKKCARSTVIFC